MKTIFEAKIKVIQMEISYKEEYFMNEQQYIEIFEKEKKQQKNSMNQIFNSQSSKEPIPHQSFSSSSKKQYNEIPQGTIQKKQKKQKFIKKNNTKDEVSNMSKKLSKDSLLNRGIKNDKDNMDSYQIMLQILESRMKKAKYSMIKAKYEYMKQLLLQKKNNQDQSEEKLEKIQKGLRKESLKRYTRIPDNIKEKIKNMFFHGGFQRSEIKKSLQQENIDISEMSIWRLTTLQGKVNVSEQSQKLQNQRY